MPSKQKINALVAAADGAHGRVRQWVETHGADAVDQKDFYGWTALPQSRPSRTALNS